MYVCIYLFVITIFADFFFFKQLQRIDSLPQIDKVTARVNCTKFEYCPAFPWEIRDLFVGKFVWSVKLRHVCITYGFTPVKYISISECSISLEISWLVENA